MAGKRRLILKVCLGIAAGLISVSIINMLGERGFYYSWTQILGAALIGTVAGIAEVSRRKLLLGVVLGCIGWIVGGLVSKMLPLPIGTWPIVGGFIGLTAGIVERSVRSIIGGFLLGVAGGLIAIVMGLLTVAVDQLSGFDMQGMMLFGAGVFISLLVGLRRSQIAEAAAPVSDESGNVESLGEA